MGKRKKDPAETREQRAERKRKLCEAGEWTQCMCFLARKGRFCNMARAGGTLYCGVHFGEGGLASARGPGGRARVPCPLDPSHTVFADQVAAHVRVCTAARARAARARRTTSATRTAARPGAARSRRAAAAARSTRARCSRGARDARGARRRARAPMLPAPRAAAGATRRPTAPPRPAPPRPTPAEGDPPPKPTPPRGRRAGRAPSRRTGRHVAQQGSIVAHLARKGLLEARTSSSSSARAAARSRPRCARRGPRRTSCSSSGRA